VLVLEPVEHARSEQAVSRLVGVLSGGKFEVDHDLVWVVDVP